MMREAQATLARGRSVVIFPEGTRVVPGERPPLRAGFAGLYRALGVEVVPIALDSGRVWPRKGAKHACVVTFRFRAPIPPRLPRAEPEARVPPDKIGTASCRERVCHSLSLPVFAVSLSKNINIYFTITYVLYINTTFF